MNRRDRIESTLRGKAYFMERLRELSLEAEHYIDEKNQKMDIKANNTEKVRSGGGIDTEDKIAEAIDTYDRNIKAIREQMREECGYFLRLMKAVDELSAVEQDFVRNHYYRRLKGRALSREMKYTQRHLLRIKEEVLEKLGRVR